ncbi:MAG: chemotaxis protein CheB [Candidatus Eremiobacteraeota bacterium]|nr:chemotaxis protein CheB [Candidatus Eremiobacteraeota bacterium]
MTPPGARGAGPPLVAIGASAGGIEALRVVLPSLPANFPAAVAVVVHRPAVQEGERLTVVLARNSHLRVTTARDRGPIEAGRVYVGPAGVHLVAEAGQLHLSNSARENAARPAIDVLFRSAASAFGPRAVGVVLSGMLDDGTAGLAAIKARGGVAIVQDPAEAIFSDMPRNAIENVTVDAVVPAAEVGAVLQHFVDRIATAPHPMPSSAGRNRMEASRFSCPDCGGVLSEIDADGVLAFRCRVGHAYSPRVLFTEQEQSLEAALWTALRVLDERHEMSVRLGERARERGLHAAAAHFEQQAEVARQRAEVVRAAIDSPEVTIEAATAAGEVDDQAAMGSG